MFYKQNADPRLQTMIMIMIINEYRSKVCKIMVRLFASTLSYVHD